MTHTTGIVITLSYSGTTLSGSDYNYINNITIPAGSTGISFVLTGIDDLIIEGSETIIIDIASVLNASEEGTQQETVTILDSETNTVISLTG